MTQAKKMPYKTAFYPLFSLKMRQFGYKSPGNRLKPPPAVTIHRGNFCPKKFVSKERDLETGLYYYGARYLDSKTSRWLSGDPAMGEYVPSAPIDDEARKRNGNLPGQGGVFNYVNLHVYHYAGNNPVKYVDPDGMDDVDASVIPDAVAKKIIMRDQRKLYENNSGCCLFNTLIGAVEERTVVNLTREQKDKIFSELNQGNEPAVESDGFVNRQNDVLAKALKEVGKDKEFSAEYSDTQPSNFDSLAPENVFTARSFDKDIHFNLGDSKGKFIWEPLKYNNPNNIRKGTTNDLRYIVFTRK